jgi:hypothetical protein
MSIYPRRVVALSANYQLTPLDAGKVFEVTGSITVTVPVGLQPDFHASFLPLTGTLSLASDGTALLNGATTTLTRLFSNAVNTLVTLQKRITAADSYSVTGA